MKAHLTLQLSEFFNRVVSFDYFVIKKVIDQVTGGLEPKTVLDLGCGTGILAPMFSPKGYVGVDIHSTSVNYARRRHPQYSFQVGDATNVGLRRKFSMILVVGVVHHLGESDARKFFRAIKDHLAKDGKALIIENIPTLFWWNIPGKLVRMADRGEFIRPLEGYKKFAMVEFLVEAYNQPGGILDYGVLVLSHRRR